MGITEEAVNGTWNSNRVVFSSEYTLGLLKKKGEQMFTFLAPNLP